MIYTSGMKPANCTTCFCLVQPGEDVIQYAEQHGSQKRSKTCHADYLGERGCQGALARESVRYARICTASGNGGLVHYENVRDMK